MAPRQISPGIAHPLSRLCLSDLRSVVPCKYRALTFPAVSPQRVASSASCSSGQRFAFSSLRIRSHPRHPCRSANTSPCRACRGLTPPSECALPGAQKENPAEAGFSVLLVGSVDNERLRASYISIPPIPPMPPPWPWPPCESSLGDSATIASVVRIRPAIDAAFCSA